MTHPWESTVLDIGYEKSIAHQMKAPWWPEWAEDARRQERARRYIEATLDETVVGCSYRNCYETGTLSYVRKDGSELTPADVAALEAIKRGQSNTVTLETPLKAVVRYACDSGD